MNSYSVLMSVYGKDRPDLVLEAAASMLEQSIRPAQFVLVSDGPLPQDVRDALRQVKVLCEKGSVEFTPVELPENRGLGPALNQGLAACRHELVARMDADDVSLPDRCEKQLSYLSRHPEVTVLSGCVLEFENRLPEKTQYSGLVRKTVPLSHEEILAIAPMRNPVNHPCVMYRKSAVLSFSGYRSMPLFEDYDLWLRMLFSASKNAGQFAALSDPLLLMRTDGMYERRGGLSYAKKLYRFRLQMYQNGYISLPKHLMTTSARLFVSLIPPETRRRIYRKFLRKSC